MFPYTQKASISSETSHVQTAVATDTIKETHTHMIPCHLLGVMPSIRDGYTLTCTGCWNSIPCHTPGVEQGGGEADNGHAGEEERTEEEEVMGELEPGKVRVRALYDYEATQEGDLSFLAGDIIVTDGGAFSGEGWVTGDCDGRSGMFPANYTEPW